MSLSSDERHILRRNLGVRAPVFLRRLVAEREEELRRQAAQARDDFDTERQQAAAQELKRIREIKANATSPHDLVPALSAEQRAWILTETPAVKTALRHWLENREGPVPPGYMPPNTAAAPPPTNWREAPARAVHAEVRRLHEFGLPFSIIAQELDLPRARVRDIVPEHPGLREPLEILEGVLEDTGATTGPNASGR